MRAFFRVFLSFAVAAVSLVGCKCSPKALAELIAVNGAVQRDYAASVGQWTPSEVGAEFGFGDGVRTQRDSGGTVRFDDGARMSLEPETTVRFLEANPGSAETHVEVQAGEAVFEAGADELRIRTQMGLAVLRSGSVTRIAKGEKGLRILVSVGLARLEGVNGSQDLAAGEGVEVGIGMAILDRLLDEVPGMSPTANAPSSAPNVVDTPKDVTAKITGTGARAKPPGSKTFSPIPEGEHVLPPGTRLELSKNDAATLRRGPASADLSGPGTFVVTEDPERIVDPVLGSVVLRAEGKDVAMEIPGGTVTALGGEGLSLGEVRVDSRGAVEVQVRAGHVRVDLPDGSSTLSAGEAGNLRKGKLSIAGRGPSYFDLVLAAGGSLIVHDPSPPTAIGLSFADKCPDMVGVVVVRGKQTSTSAGRGQANVLVEPGRHGYQLRCVTESGKRSDVVAEGTLTVVADAGTVALPTRPPSNIVNTDGRQYTVTYQNLLPQVTVRWPNAPSADSYTLVWTSQGGVQRIGASTARHSFPAGRLGEGSHSFQWVTSKGRSSRLSHAAIRFDNVAPKASIRAPANGGFAPGSAVKVAGIALPGWEVRAQGQPLSMDSEQRFSGTVQSGPRGLVLQFAHPRRGVHYYLRRAAGTPH